MTPKETAENAVREMYKIKNFFSRFIVCPLESQCDDCDLFRIIVNEIEVMMKRYEIRLERGEYEDKG